jgi:sugar-specific transcriptional regulator TrmB
MNGYGEYVSVLAELGLSPSQAKVYLSLANSKSLTAQAISKTSRVARPDVYRILAQLEDAGLVERIIANPNEFHAISIEKCVSSLMQRRIMKTAELQQKTLTLTKDFRRSIADEELEEKFQFVLIPERAAVYAKAEKMIRNVQECVCFLGLTNRMISWLSACSPLLERALARKIVCRMIMPNLDTKWCDSDPMKTLGKHLSFALRLISGSPKAGFSVWDRKEVLISTSTIDTPFPAPTLWSNNRATVDLCQDYFECLWKEAHKTDLSKV